MRAQVGAHDEQFHATLVRAAGNAEMARVHWDVTERIRIIRRLDFTRADRIEATYAEHAKILRAVIQRKADQAQLLLKTHIEQSKAEVRKITLHTLHGGARARCRLTDRRAAVLRRSLLPGCRRGRRRRSRQAWPAPRRRALARRPARAGPRSSRRWPSGRQPGGIVRWPTTARRLRAREQVARRARSTAASSILSRL